MFDKIIEKPYRLISIICCIYLLGSILLNIFTGISYKTSILPYAKIISFSIEGLSLFLCFLTFFFDNKLILYYSNIELLVLSKIYTGNIYPALFLSSLLLVLLITENKILSGKNLTIFAIIEILKVSITIPYGVTVFLNYIGLTLFSMCTIICINLLFRHAYIKKDTNTFSIEDYNLSDRQKNCIKEIVLNNTTIKALAINHNVSESAIKKDLAHIYKILGITGKADLKALFIGYKFKLQNKI